MPRYTLQDSHTGQSITVEGDQPPSEADIPQLFEAYAPKLPARDWMGNYPDAAPSPNTLRMQGVAQGTVPPSNPTESDIAGLRLRNPGTGMTPFPQDPGIKAAPDPLGYIQRPLVNWAQSLSPQEVANANDTLDFGNKLQLENSMSQMERGRPLNEEEARDFEARTLGSKDRTPTPGEQAFAGVQQAGAGLANSFTSPLGIATLGLGAAPKALGILAQGGLVGAERAAQIAGGLGTAQKAVDLGFLADTAFHIPGQATEAGKASGAGTPEEKANAYASLGISGLALGGLAHGVAGAADAALRARNPTTPEVLARALDQSVRSEFNPNGTQSIDSSAIQNLRLRPRPPELPPIIEAIRTRELMGQATQEALRTEDSPAQSQAPEERGLWTKANDWADNTIKDARGRSSSGIDPTLVAAHAIKMSDFVARGAVHTYEAFKKEFLSRFPESEAYAKDVWDRLSAPDEAIFKVVDESKGVNGLKDATRRFGGSVTSLAERIGERTDTPEKLQLLKDKEEHWKQEASVVTDKMLAETDTTKRLALLDELSPVAMKRQLYREAYETATGSGSTGYHQVSNRPDYVPPMVDKVANQKIRDEVTASKASGDKFLMSMDDAIAALRRDPTKVMEGVSGLPAWLTKESAKAVLQIVRTAYIGSKSVTKAISEGVKWLRDQGVKADENEVRDWLSGQTQHDRTGSIADAGPLKTRKLASTILSSSEVNQGTKEAVAQNPDIKYQQQFVNPKEGFTSVSELAEAKTDAELRQSNPNSNTYPSDKIELAKRLMKEGNNAEASAVFGELIKNGTHFGQLINQFNQLKGIDPNYVTRVLDQQLAEKGYDPLKEFQKEDITKKSMASIEAFQKLADAKKAWRKNPTEENAAAAEKALVEAKPPALELQKAILKRQPKNLPTVLKAIIQTHLLTPASEVSNIAGNVSVMPARAASDSLATIIDAVDSAVRKVPRQIESHPIDSLKAAGRGTLAGLKEIPGILKTGISHVKTGESFLELHPLQAWVRILSGGAEVATRNGRILLGDKLALALEASPVGGMTGTVMGRGLSAGDIPFAEKSYAQAVEQQLALSKVPEAQKAFARKFPELFLKNKQMIRVADEANRAVFKQQSKIVTAVNNFFRMVGKDTLGRNGADWGDLISTVLVSPYRLTPVNLLGEYLSYTPAGLANFAVNVGKGNKLGAERAISKVIVGGMIMTAASLLYKKGLLAPSMDSNDEQQKDRLASGKVLPPDHINIDGLKRYLAGESPDFRPGDTTLAVDKMGTFGVIAHITAAAGRDAEKRPAGESNMFMDFAVKPLAETSKFMTDQSFLKGTSSALDALATGDPSKWLRNVEGTLASFPVPNTMTAISRSLSDNKVVVKDDNKLTEFNNILKQRLRVFGAGKDLPVSRGIWGEPLKETAEGANSFVYQFLDITKSQQVTQDAASVEVYRLWRRYNNSSAIPTPPGPSMEKDGKKYVLTQQQQSDLGALVGERRKQIVDRYVANPNFFKLDDAGKIRMLGRAYQTGLRIGKMEFMQSNQSLIEKKGKAAGFVPDIQESDLQLR